jgi:uncharacterized repeat protein (TIGR01451 family)
MSGGISGLQSAHRGFARAARGMLGTMLLLAMALQPGAVSPVLADPASPLQVTKTANPSPVTSGALLTYTISIKNTSGAKVDSIVMTDQVNGVGTIQSPPGLPQLTITSTQGPCTQGGANGNTVTCQVGTLNGQASATITITGQVTAAGNTNLQNTASVSGTKSAQNFTTNASVTTFVNPAASPKPDLTLNKTGPTSVAPSTPMVYTLTVNNIGNANTANVKVVDTLPSGVTLQATTPFETTSLFNCTATPPNPVTVVCQGGTVNASQNATIKINAISPAASGQITNTAIVDPDNTIPESNELNNSAAAVNTTVTTAPPPPALTIFKTDNPTQYPWSAGAGPDPVNPGQLLTYKIQITNTATTRADDVVMTDGTQALETSSITVSQAVANGTVGVGGGCTVTGAQVRCSNKSLNPGGTITITIKGIVVIGAGANIFNTATVTGNIKNQGVQASAQESTTVRPAVDLTITKAGPASVCARTWPTTSNPAAQHLSKFPPPLPNASGDIPAIGLLKPPVCLGGLTYHFVVGNSGQAQANGVAIRDWLPAGVIFDSYQSSMPGLTCTVNSSNVIDCSGGAVGPASTQTVDILVVAPATLGTITNSVTVDPNNAIFEPDETNNDATTTTDITTGIDLVVFKSDKKNVDPPGGAPPLSEGFDPIATSGTGTYTIIVDNVGTQDATGIKVRDTLPAGTKFLSVTSDQGFTCSHDGSATGGNVTCISGHLRGTESEFYQRNGTPPPPAPGDEFATIKIKFFATPFVQQVGQTMHNEVRVDPDNEIAEANELNNLATDDTVVTTGDDTIGAFNQLKIDKTQASPASNGDVATNGVLIYNINVSNAGTDPVSNVVVQDFLPAGSRFISATDITLGGPASAKFFCTHDGSATGGTITCTGGDFSGSLNVIQPGPVPTARDIKVKIFAPNTPQTAVNTATVDPNNIVPEGNEFDNDDDQATTVSPCVGQTECTNENAVYELTIEKTQNRSPIARNGLETYTLTVSNLGSDSISGVTVKDFLPAGTRFFDARDNSAVTDPSRFSCSYDGAPTGGTVTCVGGVLDGTLNTLGVGVPQSRVIQIRAFMPDTPGTYTNRSVVDPANAIPEGNEFNDESDIDTEVKNAGPNPYIDLKVTKTQSATSSGLDADCKNSGQTDCVQPGQVYFYTLHVENLGEADAFNVGVRDVLPPHVGFLSALDSAPGTGMFTCTFSDPNIDCVGGTLPAGGSRDITIRARAPFNLEALVNPGNPLTDIRLGYTNQAFIDPFNAVGEGDETNNQSSVDTTVRPKNNLTLKKEGPTGASQNEKTDYKITVTNNVVWGGGSTVTGVVVEDPLPVGLIPIGSIETTGDFVCQVEENPVNKVTCHGDLAAGANATITIHVFITADGGQLDNEACVDPGHAIDESNEIDNCQTAITDVSPAVADLAVNKSADKGTVTAGDTLTYTIAVINQGTAAITGEVKVVDPLPPDVTFVNTNPDGGWTCSESSGTVTCTRDGLGASATSNIKIQVTVNSGITAPFKNEATVTGNGETEKGSVTTSVGGVAVDLVLSGLSDNPDPANVGQNITYSFAVSNGGSSPSGSFAINSQMDTGALSGLSFVGASASQGFTCFKLPLITDFIVSCVGSLPAGQSTQVKIVFQVTGGGTTTHKLDVKTDEVNSIPESSEANNDGSETTTITGSTCSSCVDLIAGGIFDTPDPVAPNGTITRIATVSNAGDTSTAVAGANLAEISVLLDASKETLGSYSVTAGFTCSDFTIFGTIIVDCVGDLAAGQGVALTVSSTASGASDGDTLFATVLADLADNFPEGTGPGTEFTDANNDATETTSVVAP